MPLCEMCVVFFICLLTAEQISYYLQVPSQLGNAYVFDSTVPRCSDLGAHVISAPNLFHDRT